MNNPQSKAEAIVAAVLHLPSEQQAAYLDAVCGNDASLRQQVEALLREKKSADDESTITRRLPGGALSPTLSREEQPGARFDRYKLLQQIGEGGMGSVWMAEQIEPVRRQVALKVIRPGMDSKQILARFEAERQALALMDHPNIAKVLDAGTTPGGRPYFVMELVKGVPITKFCDEHQLSIPERLGLFTQVCHAIQHAHQKGIIHRDIKPSNVMVALYDGRPVPKVIDFGVAKATGQTLTERTLFTEFGAVLGTPEYMSPEQAELNQLDIDTRSDIYSLGVLLYELLTGSTPLTRETLRQAAFDEILRRIREEEPPKPSTRLSQNRDTLPSISAQRKLEPAQLTRLLQGDLDWIVLKTLEKDRGRRYETANGLAMDIHRHLANEPVVARPPSAGYRLQKLIRRNKLAVAAAGAVVAALVVGLVISIWSLAEQRKARQEADRQRHQAELNEAKAQSEAAKSQQVAQFLKDMLEGVGPSVALGRDTALLKDILEKTAERVGNDLTNQPEVEAELLSTMGDVYQALAEYQHAEMMHRRALDIRQGLWGKKSMAVADSLQGVGRALWKKRKLLQAESALREALTIRRTIHGNQHATVAEALNNLGQVLALAGKLTEAEIVFREGLATQRKLFGAHDQRVAQPLKNLTGVLLRLGKTGEAEQTIREALAIQIGKQTNSGLAASLGRLGEIQSKLGKLIEAESSFRESLAIQRRILDSKHPDVAYAVVALADNLRDQKKLDEAGLLYQEACQIWLSPAEAGDRLSLIGLRYVLRMINQMVAALNGPGNPYQSSQLRVTLLNCYRSLANSGQIEEQNTLAWLLATSAATEVRDGRSAVEYASKVIAAAGRTNAMFLDTLAAAYAEAGDFTNAVAAQSEVVALWPDSGAQARLRLYQAGKPYHQTVPDIASSLKQTEEHALRNAGLENLPAEIRMPEFLTPARRSASLFSNGSFESGASTAWQHRSWRGNKGAVSLDTNQTKSGQSSVRLQSPVADDVMCAQTVTVKTNTIYLLSGWAKTEGVVIQEQSTVRKGVNLSVWGGYESSASLVGDQDWTYLTVAFHSDDRTNVNLGARLGHHFSTCTGNAWFDDLCLIEITP